MKGVSSGHGAGDVDHLGVLAQIRQHLGVFHEQAEMAFVQGLAWTLGPFLEPVLGQQVTAIQLGRRPVVLRVPGLVGSPAAASNASVSSHGIAPSDSSTTSSRRHKAPDVPASARRAMYSA
jgi:hypothetical protein